MELEETLAAAIARWESFELDGPYEVQGAPYVISVSSMPIRFAAAAN
jgi:hypothetical protein